MADAVAGQKTIGYLKTYREGAQARNRLDVSAYRCVVVAGRNRQNSTASIISVMAGCHPACACVNVRRLQKLLEGRLAAYLQRDEWPCWLRFQLFERRFRCALKVRLKSAELLPFFPVLTPAQLNRNGWSMRKLLLGMALTMPIAFLSPATALPLAHPVMHGAAVNADLIEVKGGRGHGHGWGRGHGYRPFGWSRGRKVGWRGRGCPPGHWKMGWC
jgi:hypothetical protein